MAENCCPHCGAEPRSHSQFECWSINHGPEETRRSDPCRIRELQQRVESWKEAAEVEAREADAERARNLELGHQIKELKLELNQTLDALHALDKEDGDVNKEL